MADSSSSNLARAGGNGRPNPACSRAHQPAPMPQNDLPPLSASRVATVLAKIPGARNVTGVTRVPRRRPGSRPAIIPSVTHGSGIGSQARPTWGIWIRWSIRAMPCRPASAALRATDASHPAGPAGWLSQPDRAPLLLAGGDAGAGRVRRLKVGGVRGIGRIGGITGITWVSGIRRAGRQDQVPALGRKIGDRGPHPPQLPVEHGGGHGLVAGTVAA